MNVCIETSDSLIYPLHFRHYLAPNERFISLMLAELFLLAKLPETNAAPRPSDYVRLPGIGQKRYGSGKEAYHEEYLSWALAEGQALGEDFGNGEL